MMAFWSRFAADFYQFTVNFVWLQDEMKRLGDALKKPTVSLDKLMVQKRLILLLIARGFCCQAMADLNADKKVSLEEFTTFLETLLKRALSVLAVVAVLCLLLNVVVRCSGVPEGGRQQERQGGRQRGGQPGAHHDRRRRLLQAHL